MRVFCMAVTNKDLSGDRPTSWSAAMDQAAAGIMSGEADQPDAPKRLLMISAGNIPDGAPAAEAADPAMFPIEDPAQAWNPLTVGGFTDRDTIAHPSTAIGLPPQPWVIAAPIAGPLATGRTRRRSSPSWCSRRATVR